MSKFHIVHEDGKTRVYDAETGAVLPHVVKVVFIHSAGEEDENIKVEVTQIDWSPVVEYRGEGELKVVDATTLQDVLRRRKGIVA